MSTALSIARRLIEDDTAKAELLNHTDSTVYLLLVLSADDNDIIVAQAFRTEQGLLAWACDWARERVLDLEGNPDDFGFDPPNEGAFEAFCQQYGFTYRGILETPLET